MRPDLTATQAFGRRLGQRLWPGAVIALIGELGAGKTQLTRAIAEGLGIADSRVVTSPTFVLVQEYKARLPIYHFDAYRLKTEAEFVIKEGQKIKFDLTWYPSHENEPAPVKVHAAIQDTEKWWRKWSDRCKYEGK